MSKCMIICNTYFQLIVAIQMKLTLKKADYVILALSDHSKKADKTAAALRDTSLFEEVIFLESAVTDHKFHHRNNDIWREPEYILKSVWGESLYPALYEIDKIDELIFYNLALSTLNIFSVLYRKNPALRCSLLEEGILSYRSILTPMKGIRAKLICGMRKLLHKPNPFERASSVYCFYPEFYRGVLKPIALPLLKQDERLLSILRQVFPVDPHASQYDRKYIMLTSVYDFEGGSPVGELELVRKIAALVGQENLLVKLHPRDFRTAYEEEGFLVDRNSDYPWEAVQLSADFSDKILLTANSGSVLSISMITQHSPAVFFLYPFCSMEGNPEMKKTVQNLQEFFSDPAIQNRTVRVSVPEYLAEICEVPENE